MSFVRSSRSDVIFCCPKSLRIFDDSFAIRTRSSSAEEASFTCLMKAWQDFRINGIEIFFIFLIGSLLELLILEMELIMRTKKGCRIVVWYASAARSTKECLKAMKANEAHVFRMERKVQANMHSK